MSDYFRPERSYGMNVVCPSVRHALNVFYFMKPIAYVVLVLELVIARPSKVAGLAITYAKVRMVVERRKH